MKKILSIVLSVIVLGTFAVTAQSGEPTPIPIKKGEANPPAGSRMPQNEVVCNYDGQNLYFAFAYPEGDVTVSVTDPVAGYMEFEESSLTPFSVFVGPLQSGAQILITTDDGNSYSGYYY